ncbi:MAG: hypothetical protein Q4C80_07595 [Bacillota bacterium]|nr:hypothetical protein [Bacillota bacterium]
MPGYKRNRGGDSWLLTVTSRNRLLGNSGMPYEDTPKTEKSKMQITPSWTT